MDLLICFQDKTDNDVKVRYLGSRFFGHATAKDLSKQFKEITKSQFQLKFIDAPNVNVKFYEALKQKFNENLFHSLIGISTCSLHFIHKAF